MDMHEIGETKEILKKQNKLNNNKKNAGIGHNTQSQRSLRSRN